MLYTSYHRDGCQVNYGEWRKWEADQSAQLMSNNGNMDLLIREF